MSRYLTITLSVEVECEDDVTEQQAADMVSVVRGLIQTNIKDAVDVDVDDWNLSKVYQETEHPSEAPYVQRGPRKPGR